MYLTVLTTGKPECAEGRFRLANTIHRGRGRFGSMENEQNVHSLVCQLAGGMKRIRGDILYIKPDKTADTLILQTDMPVERETAERFGYGIVSRTDLSETMESVKNGCFVALGAKYAPTKTDAGTGKKRSIREPEGRREWLLRKMEDAGLEMVGFSELDEDHILFSHKKGPFDRKNAEFINGFHYRILARVVDRDKFEKNVRSGIGRGKAYGCGLTLFRVIERETA